MVMLALPNEMCAGEASKRTPTENRFIREIERKFERLIR